MYRWVGRRTGWGTTAAVEWVAERVEEATGRVEEAKVAATVVVERVEEATERVEEAKAPVGRVVWVAATGHEEAWFLGRP